MHILSFIAYLLVPMFLMIQPSDAQAQTWKRLCVSGGATGGANNHTWQRVNTKGSGGGTWKKVGDCVAPPTQPPEPPPPSGEPCTDADYSKPGWMATGDPSVTFVGAIGPDMCQARLGAPSEGVWMVLEGSLGSMNTCENNRKVKKVIYFDASCSEWMYAGKHRANESNITGSSARLKSLIRNFEAQIQGETPLTDAEIDRAMTY